MPSVLLTLAVLVVGVLDGALASPPPLARSHHGVSYPHATISSITASELSPGPTKAPVRGPESHGLQRRATTSFGEASVCGYFDGDKNSRLACGYNWDCVFHASNSAYPALVGCCPVSSTTQCQFLTTCYDSSQLAATPSLGSLTSDPFVTLCTSDDNVYCHTWTWPDLSMADYGCTWTSSPSVETIQTMGSLTDVTISQDMTTESLSISWVDDSVVRAIFTSTTASSSASATASETSIHDDVSDDSGGSTPVGAIVGGVVGGVIGLALIVAGVIVYRMRIKKRREGFVRDKPIDANVDSSPLAELHGKPSPGVYEMDASRQHAISELDGQGRRHELE